MPDCNANGTTDACDHAQGMSPDCQSNGVPDECEPDFDSDGLIDGCDPDIDNDGVPNEGDVCDFTPLGVFVLADGRPFGDADTSCATDRGDIRPFTQCLVPSGPLWPTTRSCGNLFDDDGDGDIDLADAARFYREFTGP